MSRKLKNPVKYIERLKENIVWLEGTKNTLLAEVGYYCGSRWFLWKNPVK